MPDFLDEGGHNGVGAEVFAGVFRHGWSVRERRAEGK
jgi:hypothetical protein